MKVLTVFGTRPEAIKMAPVVKGLEQAEGIDAKVCVTAQHRQMLDPVLNLFKIIPDVDLDLMRPGQDLFDITAGVLMGMRDVIRHERPDLLLIHGDTTTCFASALAAFYENVPIGHVEAGLRTGNLRAPFPEEANRTLAGKLTSWHFAPTQKAAENLRKENVDENRIWVTGNTVIDALFIVSDIVKNISAEFWSDLFGMKLYERIIDPKRKLILITGHRRENFGQGFVDLCNAIKKLAERHPDWDLLYPVHLNPNVQKPVFDILSGLLNVSLIEPQEYAPFVWLMNQCDLILTDSGGIQEEGPSLGKPVFVMREVTERPEAIAAGTVRLVGTRPDSIISSVEKTLLDEQVYEAMSCAINPYGDGKAVSRIISVIQKELH